MEYRKRLTTNRILVLRFSNSSQNTDFRTFRLGLKIQNLPTSPFLTVRTSKALSVLISGSVICLSFMLLHLGLNTKIILLFSKGVWLSRTLCF